MENISSYLPDLLRLVKRTYPDWNDFTHPEFVKDETGYKREASDLAKELLGKEALEKLLADEDYDGFIGRLKRVATKTNLLFMGVPQKGDLALINQPDEDPGPICRAIFDLLHGEEASEERLEAFLKFVASNVLPQKWTFPTYFLFLLYPENEIFIKPTVMNWFSKELDRTVPYWSTPNVSTYSEMRTGFHALRDELKDYGAKDMIDVQSFVWVAYRTAQKSAVFDKAVERLRSGLHELANIDDPVEIEERKDEVIGRYGEMFSVDNLSDLRAEDFQSFLRYENNQHWSGINRHGSRLVQDMPALREALAVIQDESRPLAERYDEVRQSVKGLGKAVLTPILLVTHPDQYGVWNGKVTGGLGELRLYPKVEGKYSEGRHYAEINEILNRLAEELEIDLWMLDNLWEWLNNQSKLAEPFASIFDDREQAEWAFDLFAETVERLGGKENDERFAMTVRHSDTLLRLNFGNWMLLDFSKSKGLMDLALLIEPMERNYSFKNWGKFASDETIGVFEIPLETAREWPPELQNVYATSTERIAKNFDDWKRSPYRYAHRQDIFQALFDDEKRDNLLSKGLKPVTQEKRFWRITLPSDLRRDTENAADTFNLWKDCVHRNMAAINFEDNPEDAQIARFAEIAPGDKVVAFLRKKTIGGIGDVTHPLDERTAQERPAEQDYFDGVFWWRIGVDWQPKTIGVESLPANIQNKFGQQTVLELSESEFEAVASAMENGSAVGYGESDVAKEFAGFTADSFAFMGELSANNNKKWMEENQGRWVESVREPLRTLFADIGPPLKAKFDPYLVPDALEINPTTNQVLARINKNWSATPDSLYYDFFWGAFYREGRSRKTDAHLPISLRANGVRFGFYFGDQTKAIRDRFRRRVLDEPNNFYSLLGNLKLTDDFDFARRNRKEERISIAINAASDLRDWVEDGDYELVMSLTPEEAVALGPALAGRVYDAFRRVFPVYLWAVADDPDATVERYLEGEFPVADVDLAEELDVAPEPYSEADFLEFTHLTEASATELQELLEDRKQAIFFGPPGTGKTFVAQHLGKLVTGLADPPAERMEIVQFHPAYSYEDFIEGIRPESKESDGHHIIDYPALPGVFVRFCRRAETVDGPCIFVIDEINRGNIARIFGELMLLLEYRDLDVPLPYSGERFRIPENVYVIGTMNTADRSIALVDFALRRRFHFFHFAADPDLFDRWLLAHPPILPYLGELYRRLSLEAIDDPHFAVGPSYFMRDDLDEERLGGIWRRSILPYLEEYYFDQPAKAKRWEWDSEFMRGIRENSNGN